jgi:hypothetical protein
MWIPFNSSDRLMDIAGLRRMGRDGRRMSGRITLPLPLERANMPKTRPHKLLAVFSAFFLCTAAGSVHAQNCELSSQRFSAEGSLVRDKSTGLLWSRCNLSRQFDAKTQSCDGSAYVNDSLESVVKAMPALSREFGSSCRLPTVSELRAVFNVACTRNDTERSPFAGLDGTPVWSSSRDASGNVWMLDREGNEGKPDYYQQASGAATIIGICRPSR